MSKTVGILTAAILLLMGCCILSVVAIRSSATSTATSARVATTAPTTTPRPRTPTPLPTMTAQQRTDAQIVALVKSDGQQFSATTDATGEIVITDTWADGVANEQVGLALCKIEIYHVMRDMYTKWHHPMSDVRVIILGAPFDGIDGTPVPNTFAVAILFADTEAHFDWSNLVPETAWKQYDSAISTLNQ